MGNTYSQIYIQIVFAVKGRANLIHPKWRDELHKYICGIVTKNQQKVFAVGGVTDHVHIVVSMRPNISISDLVRDIKASSSKWINEKQFVEGKFQWQSGFGAFSYAQSQLNNVIAYVDNQESHHQKQTFKEEYIDLLEKFEIDYEQQYLFDPIE